MNKFQKFCFFRMLDPKGSIRRWSPIARLIRIEVA